MTSSKDMSSSKPILAPQILPYGDHAILVQWPHDKDHPYCEETNKAVFRLAEHLQKSGWAREIMPAYDSLLCQFDLGACDQNSAARKIEKALIQTKRSPKKETGTLIEIPVFYGGENGPDIGRICETAKLDEQAVITLHSQPIYRVCMMGFLPGFAFLSPAPRKLHHPRRANPRAHIPAGSIGIADWQTGIYGIDSPGGWQIIGRTPLTMFDAKQSEPFALAPNDRVKFIPQSGGMS